MRSSAPKGTQDLLPEVTAAWQQVERQFADLCHLYGYEEIRIPTFEHTEVFQRGVGDTTDIVQKEMYTFEDLAGRSLTLRPEGTAGVVRSFVQNGLASQPFPQRLFYMITAFRYENVQKGRYREFHQLGVEAFGSEGPGIDAELLAMLWHYFGLLGLEKIDLHINNIGCPNCRAVYREALLDYLRPHQAELCEDCRGRLERNPMRVLDCKNEGCQRVTASAPLILDHLDETCQTHFSGLKRSLDALEVPYTINPRIVRGLDYYTKTVFEFVSENVGTQGTICGGGRYDGLVEALGGPSLPGIGFAMGEERLLMEMEAQGALRKPRPAAQLFIGSMGDAAWQKAQMIAQNLRKAGVAAQYELCGRSLKAQMKYAGKSGARYVMVLGDAELEAGEAQVRSLIDRDREQQTFSIHDTGALEAFFLAQTE